MYRPFPLLLLLVAACSDEPTPAAVSAPVPEAGTTCTEGERTVEGGCEPVLPEGDCAPGTRAELGSATCVAVGPQACASGFEKHASGWGCRPIIPAKACEGATRDALGSTTCVPIGDCNSAFPPANAAVFVDASFSDGQVDSTHVKTIAAGIAAASTNATVAIAPGTYAENLSVTKNVTLAGKCAAEVVVDAPTSAAGISVNGGKATIRGLTVRGGSPGVSALSIVSSIIIEDSLLEANVRAGIDVFEEAKVDARRVVIRGTKPAAASSTTNGIFADIASVVTFEDGAISGASDAGVGATGSSSITLTRSVVRDTIARADGVGGSGARGFERAKLVFVESAIVASRGVGVIVGKTKASVKLERSSVVDTKLDERPGGAAFAVSALDAATVDITDSTLADNASAGVVVRKTATAKIAKSAIVHTYGTSASGAGIAILTAAAGAVDVDDTVIFEAAYNAMQSSEAGTKLTVTRSLIAATLPSTAALKVPELRGGTALAVVRGGSAVLTGCTVEGSQEAAIAAGHEGSTLLLEGTLVRGTLANDLGLFGHAVFGATGSTITIRRSAIDGSAGVGVVFANASGSVSRTSIRRNAIGIHTQQGSTLLETADVPDPLEPGTVVVTPDSRFIENESKLGSGEIPVPGTIEEL